MLSNKNNDVTTENNAFAYWRELICFFSLAKAPRTPRTSMFILFLAQTPLRTLRLCEILLFFLSQRRRGRGELRCLFCSYLNHLCVLCVSARLYLFFLSQRRRERGELRCLFCSYLNHLCVLCASARLCLFFSLAKAPGTPGNS